MIQESIASALVRAGMATEPALQDISYRVELLSCRPDGCPLGLYDSDTRTIILPPNFLEAALFHEWGHAIGDYYHRDLSEPTAEWFRHSLKGRMEPLAIMTPEELSYLPAFDSLFAIGDRGAVEMGFRETTPQMVAYFQEGLRSYPTCQVRHGNNFLRAEFTRTVPFMPYILPLGTVFLGLMLGYGVFKIEQAVARNLIPLTIIGGGALLVYALARRADGVRGLA